MTEIFGTTGQDSLEITQIGSIAFGGAAADTITGATNANPSGSRIYGGSGADEIYVENGDTVFAGAGDDTIYNDSGANNRLYAGAGNDKIYGNSGDILVGGVGDDQFWFEPGASETIILDFNKNSETEADKIVFDSLTGIGSLDDLAPLDITTSPGDTLVKLEGGTVIATVKGVTDLTAEDFVFNFVKDNAPSNFPGAVDLGTISNETKEQPGSFSTEDLADMYKFNLAARSDVTIDLSGMSPSSNGDVFLIKDSDGNGNFDPSKDEFFGSSQNSNNADEQIVSPALATGEYYVLVTQVEGLTNYNLSVQAAEIPLVEDNAGSDFLQAAPLGELTSNITQAGSVSSNDLTDVFSFTTAPNTTVNLTLSGLDATNYADVFLVKDNGDDAFDPNTDTIIGFSQNDDGSDQAIDNALLLDGGEYYVVVTQVMGAMNYSLTLDVA